MSATGMAVHVKQKCPCGQMIEIVYHMSDAEVTVGVKFPPLAEGVFGFVEPERKLEFSGSYGKVELNGIERKDGRVICKGCGQDLVYGLIAKETTP